jgi:hypothetical protein
MNLAIINRINQPKYDESGLVLKVLIPSLTKDRIIDKAKVIKLTK